jgi:hypothetical protein
MLLAGVDPAMSQIKRLEICPLGCTAIWIGSMAVPSWRNQANSGDVNDLKEQQDEKHIIFASSLFQKNGFIAKKKPSIPANALCLWILRFVGRHFCFLLSLSRVPVILPGLN